MSFNVKIKNLLLIPIFISLFVFIVSPVISYGKQLEDT